MNPLLLTDGYKTAHHIMYPKGTTLVYSNFTPRSNKYAPKGCDQLVSFGQQMMMLQIHEAFDKDFFSKPKQVVCQEMKEELELYLGMPYDVSHFEALHDLEYLPICVKIIEEGTLVPMRVPVLTIYNTHPDFYWLTNYLETIISNLLWKPMTSATIAHTYRKVLTKWQEKTDSEKSWFIDWQGHDFSMRGMDSVDAVISSGLGHLTSFMGTDSLPTIYGARKYYGAQGQVGGSVPATEHSVMCAGGKEDETETFRRLLFCSRKSVMRPTSAKTRSSLMKLFSRLDWWPPVGWLPCLLGAQARQRGCFFWICPGAKCLAASSESPQTEQMTLKSAGKRVLLIKF